MPKNMTKVVSRVLAALVFVALGTSRAGAQTHAAPAPDSAGDDGLPTLTVRAPRLYGAWVAGAHHSAYRTRTGVPGYRDFYIASVRLGWILGDETSAVSGRYFIDLVPGAVSTDMPDYLWNNRCRPDTLCPGATPILHDAYAVGITPLGWALAFTSGRARLTLEASGGGLWFSRRIPDPVAARFNFTASAGPTFEVHMTSTEALRIGYLWHHTSNGGTGKVNPGMNSGILAVGMLWNPAVHN
jgi:hypothetical protein